MLFRLWRGKGTASQVELAAEMVKLLAGAFPGRVVHGVGDAAFHGEALIVEGTTWTTRLPSNAVLYGPKPPRTGKHGRPKVKGDRLGTCAQMAAQATWTNAVIDVYRQDTAVQVAPAGALWHGSFKTAPGRVVLIRDPDSGKPYDLGLFTLDTEAGPAAIAERYSWRWAIKPSNATGKQILGVGDACNRVEKAVGAPSRSGSSSSPCWSAGTPAMPKPRRHRSAARYARGTAPRPARQPPTCSPGCAASSSKPDFPPSGQARTATIKSTWRPGPAAAPPPDSETRVTSKRLLSAQIGGSRSGWGCGP